MDIIPVHNIEKATFFPDTKTISPNIVDTQDMFSGGINDYELELYDVQGQEKPNKTYILLLQVTTELS